MKKILFVFILIILAVGGYLFWRVFFSNPSPQAVSSPDSLAPAAVPIPVQRPAATTDSAPLFEPESETTVSVALTALTDSAVDRFWVSPDQEVYVLAAEGLYRVAASGMTEIYKKTNIDPATAKLSPDGKYFLFATESSASLGFEILQISSGVMEVLPKNILSAAWSPDSKEIVFLKEGSANNELGIYTLKSKTTKILSPFNVLDISLTWPTADQILATEKSLRSIPSSVWRFNIRTRTWERIFQNKRGFLVRWSPSGTRALTFSTDAPASLGDLTVVDASGKLVTDLDFITLPSKCAFEDDANIFCAIPRYPALGQNLPDNYYGDVFFTIDSISHINLSRATPEISAFNNALFSDRPLDADQLLVAGGTLYFLNRYDQQLYSFELPK